MSFTYKNSKNAIPICKNNDNDKVVYLLENSKVFPPVQTEYHTTHYDCPYCKKTYEKKQSFVLHMRKCDMKNHHMDTFNELKTANQTTPILFYKRCVAYISGIPGSGKSYFANSHIKNYKILYPENRVILFSVHNDDETLNYENFDEINIVDDTLDELDWKDFENCLIVFDDIESSQHARISKYVFGLMDTIIMNGRHRNISVFYLNQIMRNAGKTKCILQNASHYVFFPKTASQYSLSRTLEAYAGLTKKQIEKQINLDSRAVILHRCAPQYVIGEHDMYFVKSVV